MPPIAAKLTPTIISMGSACDLGTRRRLHGFTPQTKQPLVHPVFLGSAIPGTGVDALLAGIAELLPTA